MKLFDFVKQPTIRAGGRRRREVAREDEAEVLVPVPGDVPQINSSKSSFYLHATDYQQETDATLGSAANRMQHAARSKQRAASSTQQPKMIARHDVARNIASAQNLPQKVVTNKQSSATQRANGLPPCTQAHKQNRAGWIGGNNWSPTDSKYVLKYFLQEKPAAAAFLS